MRQQRPAVKISIHQIERINMLTITIPRADSYVQQKADWIELARKSYKLKQSIELLEKEYRACMDTLKIKAGERSAKGGGFYLSKIERKGAVDYKAIPVLQGFDLEPYRKETTFSWKLERK